MGGTNHIRVILKFLDVDHGDLRPAGVVVQGLGRLDIAGKGFASVDGMNRQPTASKLPLRLDKQVYPVNDEVELGDDAPALKVVGEKTGVVIGQRGFAAALGVPEISMRIPASSFRSIALEAKIWG